GAGPPAQHVGRHQRAQLLARQPARGLNGCGENAKGVGHGERSIRGPENQRTGGIRPYTGGCRQFGEVGGQTSWRTTLAVSPLVDVRSSAFTARSRAASAARSTWGRAASDSSVARSRARSAARSTRGLAASAAALTRSRATSAARSTRG